MGFVGSYHLCVPRKAEDGYMFIPIPSLQLVIWPVIILMLTPRVKALPMVSVLSCLGGNNPTNYHMLHHAPRLSFVFSSTT